jgi:hypothetical protein
MLCRSSPSREMREKDHPLGSCCWRQRTSHAEQRTGTVPGMNGKRRILIAAVAVSLALAAGWFALEWRSDEPQEKPIPSDAAGGLPISVTTDRQVYSVGETIVVTIENGSHSPISYYDGCSLRLCGYREGEWGCIWKECYGETVVLQPGRSIGMQTGANDHIGTRQVFELDCQIVSESAPYTARSSEFRVE